MATFGELMAQARKAAGLTQTELANRLGMSERTIQFYEQDKRTPPLKKIPLICKVLNVPSAYFSNGSASSDEQDPDDRILPEEREFLQWVDENLEGSFFYDFAKAPEESKREMMRSLRIIWELEKNRKPGDKQGE